MDKSTVTIVLGFDTQIITLVQNCSKSRTQGHHRLFRNLGKIKCLLNYHHLRKHNVGGRQKGYHQDCGQPDPRWQKISAWVKCRRLQKMTEPPARNKSFKFTIWRYYKNCQNILNKLIKNTLLVSRKELISAVGSWYNLYLSPKGWRAGVPSAIIRKTDKSYPVWNKIITFFKAQYAILKTTNLISFSATLVLIVNDVFPYVTIYVFFTESVIFVLKIINYYL